MGAVPSVGDLELPLLDTEGLPRDEATAVAAALAADHWVVRSDMGVAVLRYHDAVAILRDRRFHNALALIPEMSGAAPDDYLANRRRSILATEGEEHTRLRCLVSPAFTPAAAHRHRPTMRRVVAALLEPCVAAGRCDFVADICEPYPIPIICEVLGAPEGDWRRFSRWATDIFKIFNGNLGEDQFAVEQASRELEVYMTALIEDRRAAPGPDLLSDLIAVEEGGDRLASDELCMLAEAVLMAGTDTTRNQLGCAMALFARHPDQWALLTGAPEELAPRAVEETMRYLGAVRATVRVASCDIEYRDVLFPQGTIVVTHLAASNRDPAEFSGPDVFDLATERSTEQLTFGSGIHRCLGAALARAELEEALLVLARRLTTVWLDGPVEWKPPAFGIWGPASLPLAFTVAPGSAAASGATTQ